MQDTSNIFLFALTAVIVLALTALAIYVIISYYRLYQKAGEHGWAIFVPIYSTWVFLRMGGLPGALSLLALIPFFGSAAVGVLSIVAAHRIGQRLGRSSAFVFLYVFIFVVWAVILGNDDSKWNTDDTDAQNTIPQNPFAPSV